MPVHFQVVLKACRLPFLALTLVSIALAAGSVFYLNTTLNIYEQQPDFSLLPWIFGGAVFAHLSVNLFNEYWDFKSGLDALTNRTPFSGGSGALPANPAAAKSVLLAALVFFVLTAIAGVILLGSLFQRFSSVSFEFLLMGCFGLILVLIYTGPLQRRPLLCWAAPGLGFGVLMLYGAEIALTGKLTLALLPSVLIVFVLSSNLLLLNQLPDTDADRIIGRRHLWIVCGEGFALKMYLMGTCLIPLFLLGGINYAQWPGTSLLALFPWSLTLISWIGAKRYRKNIVEHHAYLAMNVIASLLVPLILSVVLLVG